MGGNEFLTNLSSTITGIGFVATLVVGAVQTVRRGNRKQRMLLRSQSLRIDELWAYLLKLRNALTKNGVKIPPPDSTRLAKEIRQLETEGESDDDLGGETSEV